jgi:hypothetical protein
VKTCECQTVNGDDANYCSSCGRRLPETVVAITASARADSVQTGTANADRRRRIPFVVAGFVAAALVVAIGLTLGLRNVHITINTNNLVSVQLPLNVCHTSVGIPMNTPTNLPATVHVDLASGYSTKLAFYTDKEGVIEVLAPTGWNCAAGIGADGTSSIDISPPGQAPISGESLSGNPLQVITASQTSACVGCREYLACPLFVSAAKDYQRAFQHTCPTTKPPAETETRITGHVVEFSDPPGVAGDGSPSGGVNPALGAMTYFDDVRSDGSWTETCVLPPKDTLMCKAIIGNFVHRYAKR